MHDDTEDKMVNTKKDVINNIRTALAGRGAELMYYGEEDGISTGPSSDLRTATYYAMHMICSWGMSAEFGLSVMDVSRADETQLGSELRKAVNDILKTELDNVMQILHNNRAKIDALVDALLERSQLTGAEIKEVFDSVK